MQKQDRWVWRLLAGRTTIGFTFVVAIVLLSATVVSASPSSPFPDASGATGASGSTTTGGTGPAATAVPPDLLTVACAGPSQCTAVGGSHGIAVTFNPATPDDRSLIDLGDGAELLGVSCPSLNLCTAVGGRTVVAFDPLVRAVLWRRRLAVRSDLQSVVCAAVSECTAVGDGGIEVTFRPASRASRFVQGQVDRHGVLERLDSVACPSTTQCVAVDESYLGGVTSFDPWHPDRARWVSVDKGGSLYGVACPSLRVCVAVDDRGREITFTAGLMQVVRRATVSAGGLAGVACPTTAQCTTLGGAPASGATVAVTFDPDARGEARTFVVDSRPSGFELACADRTRCATVDQGNYLATFDPQHPAYFDTTTLLP